MEPSPEPSSACDIVLVPEEPQRLALQEAAAQIIAIHNIHTQQAACSFLAATSGAQSGAQIVRELLGKAKAVSNWAKATLALVAEDKKAPLEALVKYLETLEIENVQAVQQVSKVSHRCKELMSVMAATFGKVQTSFALPGSQGSQDITLDQWDSKLIERELTHVDNLSKAIGECYEGLQSLASHDTAISLRTIQDVERAIFASDTLKDAKRQIDAIQNRRKQRQMVLKERAVEKGEVQVLRAVLADVKDKLQAERSIVEQLKTRLAEVVEHEQRLASSKNLNMEESMAELKRIQADNKEQITSLERQLAAAREQKKSTLAEVTATHEQKIRELEAELLDTEGAPGNHIIFCLDRSGSMGGVRFPAALAAIESFKAVRVGEGTVDRVSCVAFDDKANVVVTDQPINSDFVSTLRAHGPRGGTLYAPAWELVAKCASSGPVGFKLIVVFITDGVASDIPQAASVARRLHQDFSSRGGMNSFIVNIDKAVDDAVLKQLVLAGNGGQEFLKVFGETAQLLVNVTSSNMSREFKVLAALANLKEVSLKRRITLLKAREREDQSEAETAINQLEDDFAKRYQRLKLAEREAEKASQDDMEQVAKLLKRQQEELQAERHTLIASISNQTTHMQKLEGEVGKYEENIRALEQALQDSEESHQKELDVLEKSIETEVQGLEGVHMNQEILQQASGTTDVTTLMQRIDELQDLRRLCTANLFYTGDQAEMVGSLNRFLANVTDTVRDPLNGFQPQHASKADFVFSLLLKERGLSVNGSVSAQGLLAVLKHEAHTLGLDDLDAKQAVKAIQSSGITAEDFAEICSRSASKEEVAEHKKKLIQLVEQRAFEAAKVGENGRIGKELKSLKNKLKRRKDELEEAKAEKADRETLNELKEEIDDLDKEVTEKKGELEETQADVREDLKMTPQLVGVVVEACKAAYVKQMATFELQQLRNNFQLYHQNIHQPMGELVKMVDNVKRAYGSTQMSLAAADVRSVSSDLCRGYAQQQLALAPASRSDMP